MTARKPNARRGGKRAGAGRKRGDAEPRKAVSVRLPVSLVDWLDAQGPRAATVERAIRAAIATPSHAE